MDALIFPGQGSQRVGMGADLFDEVDEFKDVEKEVDALLGYSLRQLCLHDADKQLNITSFTQPALYVVNALHFYKAKAAGMRAQLLAGHSLGEYNALLAAGVFDFLTGLRLVQKRGELMAQVRNGGMAAVIGLTVDQLNKVIDEHNLDGIDVANYNSPTQTVVSGLLEDIQRAGPLLQAAGASNYVQLPVSAAFHSRHMIAAGAEFGEFLAGFTFREPEAVVISNVEARPYKKDDATQNTINLLVKQIASPVRWTSSIQYLLGRGADTFHETGPGEVLSRLVAGIRSHSHVH